MEKFLLFSLVNGKKDISIHATSADAELRKVEVLAYNHAWTEDVHVNVIPLSFIVKNFDKFAHTPEEKKALNALIQKAQ